MEIDPRLIEFARRMRTGPSPTETIAWRMLRGHRLAGFRFRRQHPIPPYIADFYCAVARLVIEFDGDTHAGREEADRVRQRYLESKGLLVLRFWNAELYDQPDAVTETIYRTCVARAAGDPRFADRLDEWGQFKPATPKADCGQ